MTNKYFNSKPDSIFEAAYRVLSEGSLADKLNATQFYRGTRGGNTHTDLSGPQYFSNLELFAKTYGSTSPHRVNVKNPLLVSNEEWPEYASDMFTDSQTIAKKVTKMGHDSVANIRKTPGGEMIVLFVVDGEKTKPN